MSLAQQRWLDKPEPGERPTRVRGPVMESSDREQRLLDMWCVRVREELVAQNEFLLRWKLAWIQIELSEC